MYQSIFLVCRVAASAAIGANYGYKCVFVFVFVCGGEVCCWFQGCQGICLAWSGPIGDAMGA